MKLGLNGSIFQTPQGEKKSIDGIGVYTQQLARELPHHDIDVQLSYSSQKQIALSHFSHGLTSSVDESQLDLYHCTNYLLPKLKSTPAICTIHDAFMFSCPELVNPKFRKIKNFLLKKYVKGAQHYITISKAMVPDLIEYWDIPAEKISVVHSGIDEHWFEAIESSKIQQVLQQYSLPSQYLLSVGTLTPRKNTLRILQAVASLPDSISQACPLVMVGKPWLASEELMKLLGQLEQAKKVIWLRYIPASDLKALYQGAKALIFPSLGEGFGYPVIEAFASRTPVLTSNITSLPEIAGDAALIVNPSEVGDISNGMEKLITNNDLCVKLIAKGNSRAKQFTWENCLKNTIKIYAAHRQ